MTTSLPYSRYLARKTHPAALAAVAEPPFAAAFRQAAADLEPFRDGIFDLQPAFRDVMADYPMLKSSGGSVDAYLARQKQPRRPESDFLLRAVAGLQPIANLPDLLRRYGELAKVTFPDVSAVELLQRVAEDGNQSSSLSSAATKTDFSHQPISMETLMPFSTAFFRNVRERNEALAIARREQSSDGGAAALYSDGIGSDGSIPGARGGEANALTPKVKMNEVRLPPTTMAPNGVLTLGQANLHYRNGNGEAVVVYAPALDFSGVNPTGFNSNGQQLFTFPKTSGDFYLYGTVTLQLNPDGKSFHVLPDTYDFDMHSWAKQPLRNLATIAGGVIANPTDKINARPYPIIFKGNIPLNRP